MKQLGTLMYHEDSEMGECDRVGEREHGPSFCAGHSMPEEKLAHEHLFQENETEEPVRANVFDDSEFEEPPKEYKNLYERISFNGFLYDGSYRRQEVELLQPRLEELGYTDVKWLPGETDSFGPLTRVCKAKGPSGQTEWFVYG